METVIEKGPGFGLDREAVGYDSMNESAWPMLNIPSYIGGNLIEGGADTTSAFLQTLILALVNFPDVQARAQEELDSVIGDERSPQRDDIERLPYIRALIKEVGCRSRGSSDHLISFALDAPLAARRPHHSSTHKHRRFCLQ